MDVLVVLENRVRKQDIDESVFFFDYMRRKRVFFCFSGDKRCIYE